MPKTTKTASFLAEMNAVLPWKQLLKVIEPHYKTGQGGRPAQPLERMLRIYFLQIWYTLSDPAMEDELYEKYSFQHFVGLDGMSIKPPDETTILNFRHLLEQHNLAQALLATVNSYLADKGLLCKQGTITDATLIHAPSSTKNAEGLRDPEMSSTQKNRQWYFGAKGHIGVQANGKPIIHTAILTTAKAHDYPVSERLYHGEEKAVFGDGAYGSDEDKRLARELGIYYGVIEKRKRGQKRLIPIDGLNSVFSFASSSGWHRDQPLRKWNCRGSSPWLPVSGFYAIQSVNWYKYCSEEAKPSS